MLLFLKALYESFLFWFVCLLLSASTLLLLFLTALRKNFHHFPPVSPTLLLMTILVVPAEGSLLLMAHCSSCRSPQGCGEGRAVAGAHRQNCVLLQRKGGTWLQKHTATDRHQEPEQPGFQGSGGGRGPHAGNQGLPPWQIHPHPA